MATHFTCLLIQILLIIIVVSVSPKSIANFDFDKIFKDEIGNQQLPDLAISIDSSEPDSEISKEVQKYHDYLAKLNQKYYTQTFKDHLSNEEKKELNYYEELLKKIKKINKVNRGRY